MRAEAGEVRRPCQCGITESPTTRVVLQGSRNAYTITIRPNGPESGPGDESCCKEGRRRKGKDGLVDAQRFGRLTDRTRLVVISTGLIWRVGTPDQLLRIKATPYLAYRLPVPWLKCFGGPAGSEGCSQTQTGRRTFESERPTIQMSNDSDYHYYLKGWLEDHCNWQIVVLEARLDPWVGQMLVELLRSQQAWLLSRSGSEICPDRDYISIVDQVAANAH